MTRAKSQQLSNQFLFVEKNPAGREMFETIQGAYEILLPIVESGQHIRAFTDDDGDDLSESDQDAVSKSADGFGGGVAQMETMELLIKTQSMICRRFEKEIGKYKYPAYQILLSCLKWPASSSDSDPSEVLRSCLMTSKRAEFVRHAVELVYRTCVVSPLNAEELVVESGVAILDSLLDFYIHAAHSLGKNGSLSSGSASDETITEIISYIIHTLAGIAYYDSGRNAIVSLPDCSRLCINWRRCLDGKYLGSRVAKVGDSLIKKFALEGVGNLAKNRELQIMLIGSGIVWPLGKLLLGYDPTLEQVSGARDGQDDDIGISQAASNAQARLSARALGMLSGSLQDTSLKTPQNEPLAFALGKLLTTPVALLLRNKRTSEILRTLNTNVETPARIWNVGMRTELLTFLELMEKERPEDSNRSVEDELAKVSDFSYSALKDELRIGGVYVRVFDQMGADREALRDIHNPGIFAKHILDFIARSINDSNELPKGWVELTLSIDSECKEEDGDEERALASVPIRDKRFVMAITALNILVRVDGLIDDVLCDDSARIASVLLSLLELPQESEVSFDDVGLSHPSCRSNLILLHSLYCRRLRSDAIFSLS
jgi:hypothetical protein